ncbi:GNAT family N-acetyltransferase [Rubrobacter tropicus]|uniref:Lysine N-acyltransferase MbtK n=1 Tax=Rubrobacter tropicus TaxID=2653851 RepID=A0A6G8QC21_9ACTN|nr:GNAT family N-acetyltransferase [Rubrobacter tropicus]QIN84054.1 GNAT family N-acetyltransferase [Rubrobacter tropicus]
MPVLAETGEGPGKAGGMGPREVSFRRLRSSDLDLLHRWLNAPHVLRWWYDEGTSYREIEERYLPRIEGRETVKPFAILHQDNPIGYIQSYPISDGGDEQYAALVDVEASAGVDLFIGDPRYVHRGLGQYIVRAFLSEHVFSNPGVEVCAIGPEPKNKAAIRAYEKAGFRFFKTVQIPGKPETEYLMTLTRKEFEGHFD